MIETRSLTMHYGETVAVDGLDLHIPQGELFAFLGPNAAGKTTTIKMLTGLLQPARGQALICGHDIQKDPVGAKALLGYVPDVAAFYEKLTPLEFARFIADIFGVDPRSANRRARQYFERFSLLEYGGDLIETLSHGTRQRLAIACALLHEPRVIVIDEPMVGLDPLHARAVKEELKAQSEAGVTVFMSTHLLNLAEELAARIGIIHQGRLVAIGTMEDLRRRRREDTALEDIFLSVVEEADGPQGVNKT